MIEISSCITSTITYLAVLTRFIIENPFQIIFFLIIGGIMMKTKLLKYLLGLLSLLISQLSAAAASSTIITSILSIVVVSETFAATSLSSQIKLIMSPILMLFSFFIVSESKAPLKTVTAIISALLAPLFLISPAYAAIYAAIHIYIILFAAKSEFMGLTIPIIYIVVILFLLSTPALGFCQTISEFISEEAIQSFINSPFKLPQV